MKQSLLQLKQLGDILAKYMFQLKRKGEIYQSCQSCQELLQAKVTAPPCIVLNY